MDQKEAYEILGISPEPEENIKKAYLRLSKENHPDRGGNPEVFLKIHEAYTTLTQVQEPPKNKQEIVDIHIQISLEEAIFGVTLETHVKPQMVSSTPLITQGSSRATLDLVTIVEKIPPMILLQTSFSHVYKNKMIMGSERTIRATYSVREHERYKMNKITDCLLSVDESIPVEFAICGGVVEVKTLFGIRKLAIKPGTNIGDIYQIKNHGPLGNLGVVISGLKMPEIKDLDGNNENEKVVEQEEKELLANEQKAKELKN